MEDDEIVFDSDRYTQEIINSDDNEEENEEETVEDIIFKCEVCGYMVDTKNPPIDPNNSKKKLDINDYIYKNEPSKIQCPNCGKKVNFVNITRKEYEELSKKKQNNKAKEEDKKKIKEKRDRERRVELLRDDLKDLLEDLSERLFSGEISSKRLVYIFSNLSVRLYNRYNKKRDFDIDSIEYRKIIYSLSDDVLASYKEKQKSEEILAEYDEGIEQDELYRAELEYYIEDNEYSIPDYELRKRIREYEKMDKQIKHEEYKREIEEKYQDRRNSLLKKANERKERQKLHDIM